MCTPPSFDPAPRARIVAPMLRPQARFPRPTDGFALLVTIVLVAFLVLILVGLATFTRVETQVANNTQHLAQARQNALFGLNLALGELQRHLGPDQRATARVDLLDTASPNPLWIGVWGNAASPSSQVPDAARLTWLVSGNESAGHDVTLAGADFGRITAVTTAPTRPPSATYTDADSVVLLGPGTTSRSAAAYATVRAPLVTIDIPADQAPGLAGNAPTTIGRYAWWADDESQKARLDLDDLHAATADRAYSFGAAQRSAIELMAREPEPAAYGGTALGSTAFPRVNPALAKVLAPAQAAFAAPAGQETAIRDFVRARSADFTVTAASVLADARRGGLKQDLTRILASTTTGPADTDPLFDDPDNRPASDPFFLRPPTWGQLRSFAGLTASTLPIQTPTATRQGVHPVVLWAETGLAVGHTPGATPPNGTLRVHLFPKLVLWNPYTSPLAAADYEFGLRGERFVRVDNASGAQLIGIDLRRSILATGTVSTASPGFFRFRVTTGVLAPGEARLFTLQASGDYNAGANVLVAAVNTDESVSIAHGTEVAPPARLGNLPTGGGAGEVFFYLRPVGSTVPAAFNPPDADSYQWSARIGVANRFTAATQAIGAPPTPLAPDFKQLAWARLGNVNNALTARWIAQGNIRAPFAARTHLGSDYGSRAHQFNGLFAPGTFAPLDDDDGAVSVGENFNLSGSSANRLALFAAPAAHRPLLGIADLRHANLAHADTGPAYPIGNSLADFRILRATTSRLPTQQSSNLTHNYRLFDHSFLLNDLLWDRYTFSTVPSGISAANLADPGYRLPNSRHRALPGATPAALTDHLAAARHLLLQGGFNANSTSVQAWRAMLGALHGLPYDPVNDTAGSALDRPFSRYPRPLAGSADPWTGFRELSSDQLDALAENIVSEIRARAATNTTATPGPFLHLSQFVNRRLVAAGPAADAAFGIKGALQAAIDATDRESTDTRRLNDRHPYDQDSSGDPASAADYDADHFRGGTSASLPVSSRNAFGPGHLTQADVLAVIGPSLTVRGDTFTLRVYGEAVSPLDSSEVLGRAWAEAVVQRLPDHVDPAADAAEVAPSSLTSAENRRFGRRFNLVSFRWLTPADL
jgi:hypothetical protein